jgi:hypothetical protein
MSRDSFENWLVETLAQLRRGTGGVEQFLDDPSPRPTKSAAANHAIGALAGAAAALGVTVRELLDEYGGASPTATRSPRGRRPSPGRPTAAAPTRNVRSRR